MVSLIAVCVLGLTAEQSRHLLERALESLAGKGIIVQRFDADNPVVAGVGDHRDLAAELILMGLSLSNAFHFRTMQAVELVLVVVLVG